MNILSICDNPDVLQVMRIINIVITIIKIAVPILLIIFIMIELIGAVADEEKFKKVTSGAVKKFIAALLIFLIPTLVQVIVVNVVGSNETNEEYKNCLKDLSVEQINKIYEKNALEAIVKAESTNNYNDYSNAVLLTHKIPDNDVRNEYMNRLNVVKAKIDLINENNKKNNSSNASNLKPNGSTIYIGDSRTNGMKSVGLDSNEQVIATDGGNYEAFLKDMAAAKNKLSGNKTYNVVLNYGVNDLRDVDKYCSKYKEFISSVDKGNTFYIVSVNPVRRNSNKTGATNSSIETFNEKIGSCISDITNAKYCDVYKSTNLDTWEKSYIKSDDIHYTTDGYKFIHSKIKECIG